MRGLAMKCADMATGSDLGRIKSDEGKQPMSPQEALDFSLKKSSEVILSQLIICISYESSTILML